MTDNNLTDDQFIHTVILKKCWHEFEFCQEAERVSQYGRRVVCGKCDTVRDLIPERPAYSESLDLIAPVESLVVSRHSRKAYWKILEAVCDSDDPFYLPLATTQERAKAIRSLWESKAESATRKEAKE